MGPPVTHQGEGQLEDKPSTTFGRGMISPDTQTLCPYCRFEHCMLRRRYYLRHHFQFGWPAPIRRPANLMFERPPYKLERFLPRPSVTFGVAAPFCAKCANFECLNLGVQSRWKRMLTATPVNCWWIVSYWSGREDSNLRPHGPETCNRHRLIASSPTPFK